MRSNRWLKFALPGLATVALGVSFLWEIDEVRTDRESTGTVASPAFIAPSATPQEHNWSHDNTEPEDAPNWDEQARTIVHNNSNPAERETQLRTMLENWVAYDGTAAANFAAALPTEQERLFGLCTILRVWALKDSQQALDWMRALSAGKLREVAFDQAGRAIASLDPATALSLSTEISEPNSQREYVSAVARSWASNRPEEAARWAQELPDDYMREQVSSAVAVEWAQRYPEAAADFVATSFAPGEAQASAATTVASRWAVIDPERAARWAEQFSNAALRRTILHNVLSRWVAQDHNAVKHWASSLPPGSWRTEALATLAALTEGNY